MAEGIPIVEFDLAAGFQEAGKVGQSDYEFVWVGYGWFCRVSLMTRWLGVFWIVGIDR